ncbi:MAG: MobF family relaxase [Verrucomicrobiota bacterium]
MLSISKPIKGFDQGEYYLALAAVDDYYLGGKEPPGFWLGEGAGRMGLSGTILSDVFRRLFRGYAPETGESLVHNAGSPMRRAGWDLTWSVPKSVSTLWSQAPAAVREEIEQLVVAAVQEGVSYLESVGVVSRRGEGGVIRDRASLIFAAFPHSTSRALDPQLHIHTILFNVAMRPDGSTGTIEPKELFRHQHAADAIFRAELAAQLERSLGLRAVRVGKAFEILGVDRTLIETFSKRRKEIEALLEERGLSGAKAAEMVAFETRKAKVAVDRDQLFEEWRRIGLQHGWSGREVSLLLHAPLASRAFEREREGAKIGALSALTFHDSHFSLRDLTRALGDEAQGRGISAREVYSLRDALLVTRHVLPVGIRERETRFTTPEMLRMEKALLITARQLRQQHGAEVAFTPKRVALEIQRHELSAEQTQVVREVTKAWGGLHLVVGMAGTGKTTTFRAAREIWDQQGVTVYGGCLSGKAASGLEVGTGIRSATLHRLLWGLEHGAVILHPRAAVLVDEAAMVGTRQLLDLATRCQEAGAKLVLVGDAGQLQAVEAGGAFAALVRVHGASSLTEIWRQREEWARQAVRDLAAGEAGSALSAFGERGLLHVRDSPESAQSALVREWSARVETPGAGEVILSGTNAEVAELNDLIQKRRFHERKLLGQPVYLGNGPVYVGDRVLFTRNSQALGVFNGELGTVTSQSEARLSIAVDGRREVYVEPASYPHLQLGYAITTHKAQGMTTQQAFVLPGKIVNRELAYVQASRARGDTRFFFGFDSLDLAAERMSRSQPKELACAVLAEAGPALEHCLVP